MHISAIKIKNFRAIANAELSDLPFVVVLVSRNGAGKSSLFEAIAGVQYVVAPHSGQRPQQHNHTGVTLWPSHLRDPVRFGAPAAEVSVTITATESEQTALRLSTANTQISFSITPDRRVSDLQVDDNAKAILARGARVKNIGFLDLIRANRYYRETSVGSLDNALSDKLWSDALGGIHREGLETERFGGIKRYISALTLSDHTFLKSNGRQRDSLESFRLGFDNLLAPKTYLGPTPIDNGNIGIVVKTGDGYEHDIDDMSDGEKELVHIMCHFHRMADRANTVLWDTPESHLNAAVQAKLIPALQRIAPLTRFWFATHSLPMIASTPLESIFPIDGSSGVVSNARSHGRDRVLRMYEDVGAQIGLQLVSSLVVITEGKARSDAKGVSTLLTRFNNVTVVPGGDKEAVYRAGTRIQQVLQDSTGKGGVLAIADPDYSTVENIDSLVRRMDGSLFFWPFHEYENLFLDPIVIKATLPFVGHTAPITEEAIAKNIDQSAYNLRDWVAADWVRWELAQSTQVPSGHIRSDDPRGSLNDFVTRLRESRTHSTDENNIDKKYAERLNDIDRLIKKGEAPKKIPGKQLLARFITDHLRGVTQEAFISAALGVLAQDHVVSPAIQSLRAAVENALRRQVANPVQPPPSR